MLLKRLLILSEQMGEISIQHSNESLQYRHFVDKLILRKKSHDETKLIELCTVPHQRITTDLKSAKIFPNPYVNLMGVITNNQNWVHFFLNHHVLQKSRDLFFFFPGCVK